MNVFLLTGTVTGTVKHTARNSDGIPEFQFELASRDFPRGQPRIVKYPIKALGKLADRMHVECPDQTALTIRGKVLWEPEPTIIVDDYERQ